MSFTQQDGRFASMKARTERGIRRTTDVTGPFARLCLHLRVGCVCALAFVSARVHVVGSAVHAQVENIVLEGVVEQSVYVDNTRCHLGLTAPGC